jgi:hypothetical protein
MRNENVQAVLVALGPKRRIPDEEISSRLGEVLDEFKALAGLQKAINPPGYVRGHWRVIERHAKALYEALDLTADETKKGFIFGGLLATHLPSDIFESWEAVFDKVDQASTLAEGLKAYGAVIDKEHQLSRFKAQVIAALQQYRGFMKALDDIKTVASNAAKHGGHRIPGRHGGRGRPADVALDTLFASLMKLYQDATGERAQSGIKCDPITGETTGRFIDFATIALSPLKDELRDNPQTPGMVRARVNRLLPPTQNSRKKLILRM